MRLRAYRISVNGPWPEYFIRERDDRAGLVARVWIFA